MYSTNEQIGLEIAIRFDLQVEHCLTTLMQVVETWIASVHTPAV